MKKLFSNKLVTGFSASLLFIYGIIFACSDGFWDQDFQWSTNFTPETFVNESYSPLLLSGGFFYKIGFDSEYNSRFNDLNVEDWKTYLKKDMPAKEIKFFLTDTSHMHVDGLHIYFKTKKPNTFSKIWESRINLKDKKTKSFIEFLNLAQQIETVSIADDYWGYEPVKQKKLNDLDLIKEIEKNYNTAKDPFLKNRYWFQAIKGYFYSDDKERLFDFFNKTKNQVPKNTLYFRAVSYVAGMHFKAKNYATANYLYALVFDKCPELRVVTSYSFHPQADNDWNQSLQMAQSNQEKAALWALRGYYGDEKNAIEKIYELQPSSEHLDYLLTRLINAEEAKTEFSSQEYRWEENKQKQKIDQFALNLVIKIAQSTATHNPFMWQLAAGYLQTLNANYDQANVYFNQADKMLPKTTLAVKQLRLLRFITNLSGIKTLNAANQKRILADLHWLYEELPKEQNTDFRYMNAVSWSKKYLSGLAKRDKNVVMEELFLQSDSYEYYQKGYSFYDNESNLLAMKKFLMKMDKTELEQIAATIYPLKVNDISNFQAVKATFNNRISAAITFVNESESGRTHTFLGNPFNGTIKDCHDCDHVAFQKRKWTTLDFLTTIQQMQAKIDNGDDVYNNALLVGNAFYNISHFGNGRTFYEITIVGYGSSPTYFRQPMMEMITDNSLATKYYKKALAAAKTNDQKAKCVYLLAKCERNQFYNDRYYFQNKNYWEYYGDKTNFLAWKGFQELQKNYSETKYYREVIQDCGYFNTYVKQLQ